MLAEGGNALEAMVAMAATIAVVYPHMNHIGGDGFWLVREPSGSVRAPDGGGRGRRAARRPSSIATHGHDAIPSRGPLAALTVPGAVGGWMLALEAAKAQRRAAAARRAARLPPSATPREGYGRRAASARLTTREAVPSCRTCRALPQTFLVDGKPPAEARDAASRPALAATLDQLAHAGLDDFYRGDVGREIAADLERIGSPVTRADLEALPRQRRRAALGRARSRHALQHAAADAGPRFADDPRAVRPARRHARPRASITCTAWSRRPSARLRVRDRVRHRSGAAAASARPLSRRRRSSTPRPPRSTAARRAPWQARAGEGDTIWMGAADASGLVVSYIQSLYWEFGSGCVLPQDRRADAEPRHQLLARPARAQCAASPAGCRCTRSIRALAVLRDGRVMAYGTMGGDAQPQIQAALFHRHVLLPAAARPGARSAALADRPHLGLAARQPAGGGALRRRPDRPARCRRPRRRRAGRALFRRPWATPARWCCHPDGSCEGAHDPRADGGAAGV